MAALVALVCGYGLTIVCFVVALIAGVMASREGDGLRRARLQFAGSFCVGLAVLLLGITPMAVREFSPRFATTGTIVWMRSSEGRSWTSCKVRVAEDDGSVVQLTGSFSCNELAQGVRVRATWIAVTGSVLGMDILSGSHAGTHLNDAMPVPAVACIASGAFILWGASRRKKRELLRFAERDTETS